MSKGLAVFPFFGWLRNGAEWWQRSRFSLPNSRTEVTCFFVIVKSDCIYNFMVGFRRKYLRHLFPNESESCWCSHIPSSSPRSGFVLFRVYWSGRGGLKATSSPPISGKGRPSIAPSSLSFSGGFYYEWGKGTKFLLAVMYKLPHPNSSEIFKKDWKK